MCGWAWRAGKRDFRKGNHFCSEVMLTQNIMDNSEVPQQAGAAQHADFVPHTTVLSTSTPPFPAHPIQPYPFSSGYTTLQSGLPPPLPVQLPQINMKLLCPPR